MTIVQEHIEVPPEWWRSFFQGLVLELWRRAMLEADSHVTGPR